jgi:TonB family protein
MLIAAACTPPAVIRRIDAAFPAGVYPNPKGPTIDAGVRVVLAPDGTVTGAQIVHTSGIPSFDARAVSTAERWQFAPPAPSCGDDAANVVQIPFPHAPLPSVPYDPCAHDVLALTQVVPEYPDVARSMGLGRRDVTVLVDVDGNGQPTAMKVIQSSGNMAMDAAAERAAGLSTYSPKFAGCKPVAGQYRFRVTYQ